MSILRPVFLGVAAWASASGCAHFQGGPRPLYPGPALPPGETALLSGYIAKVDGVDVSSLGGPFSLLPGCHVVVTRDKLGDGSPSGAWRNVMAPMTFALRMQAGRSYEIQARRQGSGSETSNLKMRAVELDAQGNKLAEVTASHGRADIEACQAWDAEQSKDEERSEQSPSPASPQ